MKNLILTSVAVLFIVLNSFSQNLYYAVNGMYAHPVVKEKLDKALFLSDLIPDYPVNWIEEYASVEILSTYNGKTTKAVGKNDILSQEQKNMLNAAKITTDIVINVNYKRKNVVTNAVNNHTINISYTVVPEVEAEFVGGKLQMMSYLNEKGIDKILEKLPKGFRGFIIRFTIDETGKVTNTLVSKTSGSEKIDKLLLEAINKMPNWTPAQNANGVKVKQEFEFNVGGGVDGC